MSVFDQTRLCEQTEQCFLKSNSFKEGFAVISYQKSLRLYYKTQRLSLIQSISCVTEHAVLKTRSNQSGTDVENTVQYSVGHNFHIKEQSSERADTRDHDQTQSAAHTNMLCVINYNMNSINTAACGVTYRHFVSIFSLYFRPPICFILLVAYFTKANASFCFLLIMKLKVGVCC